MAVSMIDLRGAYRGNGKKGGSRLPRRLCGIGVDIVAYPRILGFLSRHAKRHCGRMLSKAERLEWRKQKYDPEMFAKFFTAKEAFFKAVRGTWMGPQDFCSFEIECLFRNYFRVKSLHPTKVGQREAYGSFFQKKEYIGAHVICWQ